MAENKKSFVAYCDWGEIFDDLTNEEAGKLVKHLFDYVRDENPESDKLTNLLFIQIKQSLKRDLKKYEKYVDKQRVNGSKGGRPKKPKETQKTQAFISKPKKADSVNVSVSDNVNVNDSERDINIKRCLHNCIEYFPHHLIPDGLAPWIETIDKLNRIDKIPFEIIEQIVKKTREDNFWSKNFLSLTKLRKKNKDGIMYVIVFNEQIKSQDNGTTKTRKQQYREAIQGLSDSE
jgi:hypothetical protein